MANVNDTNFVVLIGRLTRDAVINSTGTGKSVARFSLAVNKKRKEGEEWKDAARFFDIVLWGQLAGALHPYLTKGKQVAITGELDQEKWDKDGETRSRVTVVAHTVQLLGGSSNSDSKPNGGKPGENNPPPTGPADDTADIPW